jgi:hypothetical protein
MELVELEQPTPDVLIALLERHHLLPMSLRRDPTLAVGAAASCNCLRIDLGEEPGMLILEFPGGEPGTARLEVIALQKRVDKRADDIKAKAHEFYNRWFTGYGLHRVETTVPSTRKQVPRVLKALGFVEETYRGVGIRNAVDFGKGPETLYLYSLTPNDVAPATEKEPETVEVASE